MNRVILVVPAAAAVLALAACGGHGKTGSSASSAASAMATSTVMQQAKANLAAISTKCGTDTATGQIAAVKELGSKAGRETLWTKCGVPASKRPQVEEQALAAAEKGHLVSGGKPARVTYFTVTLPQIILAAQS